MTSQYRKGADKERMIVNVARSKGLIALRSAGSKSPIDVVTVDFIGKHIKLVQSKLNIDDAMKKRLEDKYSFLNGTYTVEFVVC
jgi:Holliday junction resolvase